MQIHAEKSGSDKIIYQYKLLKKYHNHPAVSILYIMMLLLWLSLLAVWADAGAFLWGIGAIAGWQLVYYTVTLALLRREEEHTVHRTRYAWRLPLPWCGYLPGASTPFRKFRTVQLHLILVGILLSAALSVWLTPEAACSVGFVHLWWMAPRLYLVAAMGRFASSGSMISFAAKDVGLYEA